MPPILELFNVAKRYREGGDVLAEITFRIEPGEMVFLTGRSGAGKSTLLKLIPLIERPTRGQIFWDGRAINRIADRDIPHHRRRFGLIFQDYRLLNDRSVFDNVALPLIIAGYSHQEVGRRVRAALDKVGLLRKETRSPAGLSGGEQQRVGIARAIVHKPPVILADEPTGNLDPELSEEIMALFGELRETGATLLIASHDLALIARHRCRTLRLDGGRLAEDD